MNYTGGDVAEQLRSMQVSADFFRCWGIPILQRARIHAGRRLAERASSRPDQPGFCGASRFASDPQILGKTISLSGEPYTVIGMRGKQLRTCANSGRLRTCSCRSSSIPTAAIKAITFRRWRG